MSGFGSRLGFGKCVKIGCLIIFGGGAIIICNIMVRSIDLIREASAISTGCPSTVSAIGCDEPMPFFFRVFPNRHYYDSTIDSVLESLTEVDIDLDGDGLTGEQEFLRFTNDMCNDTDGDGLIDSEDSCARCRIFDHFGAVLGVLVDGLFNFCNEPGFAENGDRVYVRVPTCSFDTEGTGTDFVPIGEAEYQCLLVFFDYDIYDKISILEPEILVSIPGLLYVFRCRFSCGSRCGWVRIAYVLDLPFLGPSFAGSEEVLRE
jgi:hypothetical protein